MIKNMIIEASLWLIIAALTVLGGYWFITACYYIYGKGWLS